jgi:hypothetical protein
MAPVLDHRHPTLSSLARNIDTENEDDRVFFFSVIYWQKRGGRGTSMTAG